VRSVLSSELIASTILSIELPFWEAFPSRLIVAALLVEVSVIVSVSVRPAPIPLVRTIDPVLDACAAAVLMVIA